MSQNKFMKSFNECCGCGACVNVCNHDAIKMIENETGFLYPVIDEEKCNNCGLCEKTCVYAKDVSKKSLKETYVAVAKDINILNSASGGIFASIANMVLKEGGYVYGAAIQFDEEKINVNHIEISQVSDLYRLKGSKYIQSETTDIFVTIKKRLLENKVVLFSGTPCQIAGLKGFLKKDYENLYTIEVICHGVPSVQMFNEYIRLVEKKKNKKVANYKFRDKTNGWKLHGCMELRDVDGKKEIIYFEPEESSYYQLFLNSYTYRENCYSCPYASENRQGDITIGDYWGIELVHSELIGNSNGLLDYKEGISCLIINSIKGKKLVNKYGTGMQMWNSTYDKASKYNAQLLKPSVLKKEREIVMKLYKQGYMNIESWYQKRLLKIKFERNIRRMIPRFIKNGMKRLLSR